MNAVLDSMDGAASVEKGAFFRPYSDKEAAGMKYFGYPKSDLIPRSSGLIYDWRLGIPAALQLISYRLYLIAAIQPNFRTDPQYVKELTQYRNALQRHYDLMLSGVRCSARSGGSLSDFPVRCADIRSDYSVSAFRLSPYRVAYGYFTRFWDPTTRFHYGENSSTPGSNVAGQGSDAEILSFERAQVRNQMPLFEVKAMIDTLYLYTHPTSDLTEVSNRITPMASTTFCLDVTGLLRGPIYGREAQLVRCNGSASQRWIYDRRGGTVKTPPTGTTTEQCLGLTDWAGAIHVSGDAFYVGTADCVAADRSQRWTYDSERKTLLNAWGGTVLDIKWNNLNPGAEVWSWPVNYTTAQLWRADQRSPRVPVPPPPF